MTFPHDAPGGTDQERVRNPADAELALQLSALVVRIRVFDTLGFDPSFGVALAFVGDTENGQPFGAETFLELIEVRNCTSAGASPICEELDEHRATGEVVERLGLRVREPFDFDGRQLTTGVRGARRKCDRSEQGRCGEDESNVHARETSTSGERRVAPV
jgi:hypothetical protein